MDGKRISFSAALVGPAHTTFRVPGESYRQPPTAMAVTECRLCARLPQLLLMCGAFTDVL